MNYRWNNNVLSWRVAAVSYQMETRDEVRAYIDHSPNELIEALPEHQDFTLEELIENIARRFDWLKERLETDTPVVQYTMGEWQNCSWHEYQEDDKLRFTSVRPSTDDERATWDKYTNEDARKAEAAKKAVDEKAADEKAKRIEAAKRLLEKEGIL